MSLQQRVVLLELEVRCLKSVDALLKLVVFGEKSVDDVLIMAVLVSRRWSELEKIPNGRALLGKVSYAVSIADSIRTLDKKRARPVGQRGRSTCLEALPGIGPMST